MKIGGWLRLWIVLSALWLIPMAILAYDQQPTREKIISNWSYEGISAVANRVAQIEKYAIQAHEVSADIYEEHPTPSQAIEWLKKIEAKPVDDQRKLSSTVAPINEKYERSLDQLSNEQARHFGVFFLFWLIPLLLLLIFGTSVRWVWRGFRPLDTKK